MRLQFDRNMLVVYGPTGAGKSDLACAIAQKISAEIVNADMGQLYTGLSIGTAKPNWRAEPVPHHLFDVISQPCNCTVIEYRKMLSLVLDDIWSRGKLPIIVGGSGFYVQSIFYPPFAGHTAIESHGTWEDLNAVDPERAAKIHPHDRYRILRALSIWRASGVKPSDCVRKFAPLAAGHIIWVGRERDELYKRINERVLIMIKQGWVDECRAFLGTEWEDFVRQKKLIGYTELFEYLRGGIGFDEAVASISQKTRAYAKRQETFWRMLKRSFACELGYQQSISVEELNLTVTDHSLYIDQLSQKFA